MTIKEKYGWIETGLGQLCDVVRGGSPRPMGDPRYFGGNIPFIKIGDITKIDGNTLFDSEIHVNEEGAKKSRLLKKGSLILSNSGTVCIPKFLGVDACIHDGFVSFNNIPDFVSQNFLFHYFHYIRPYVIQKHKQGVTQVNLNTTIVSEFNFPLPPLPEQRAIVSRIEQLFSELDNGIANLRLAQEQLKVYRQAVLKKAFEGELTGKWREQQTDLPDARDLLDQISKEREEAAKASGRKVKPVKALTEDEITQLPGLPEGWRWVKIEEIATKITDGEHITPERTESGYHLLSARNIQNGYLDFTTVDYVPVDEYLRIRNRCDPEEGDVLISCSGSVGRICSVPKNSDFVMVRSVALIKLPPILKSNKFIEYQLRSPLLQRQIEKGKKATAQANLFLGPISNLKIVLCSLPEQHAIVEEIETRLSVCDKMAQDIDEALEKAEALRQSILKKAFEGKLLSDRELAEVRSAEDWEPADVLLERIRAERAGNGKR